MAEAVNQRGFVDGLRTVPAVVVCQHAARSDFTRWTADVYHDHLLAAPVHTGESDLARHGDAEQARRLLIESLATPCPASS